MMTLINESAWLQKKMEARYGMAKARQTRNFCFGRERNLRQSME